MDYLLPEAIRKVRGRLPQAAFAREIGIHRTTLANIEKGRQHPSIAVLLALASFADSVDESALGTLFHKAAQEQIGIRTTTVQTLVVTSQDEVRLCRALLYAIRTGRGPEMEQLLADDVREAEYPDHLLREAQRRADQVVQGIRAGLSDREVAFNAYCDPKFVQGYREALERAAQ